MFRDCSPFLFVAIGGFVAEPCRPRCALKEHLVAGDFCRLAFDMHRCYIRESLFCNICGAVAGDRWQTRPTKPVVLSLRTRVGDPLVAWTICNECHEGLQELARHKSSRTIQATGNRCNEGLQNANLQPPDQVWILSQVRRTTIDDQQAVLQWLQKKFASNK